MFSRTHFDLTVCGFRNDKTSYAATRTELTLACRAKLEATDLLHRWKSQLGCKSPSPLFPSFNHETKAA